MVRIHDITAIVFLLLTFFFTNTLKIHAEETQREPNLIERIFTPSRSEKTHEEEVTEEKVPPPSYATERRWREEARENTRIADELEAQNTLMERAKSPHGCEIFQRIEYSQDYYGLEEVEEPRVECY